MSSTANGQTALGDAPSPWPFCTRMACQVSEEIVSELRRYSKMSLLIEHHCPHPNCPVCWERTESVAAGVRKASRPPSARGKGQERGPPHLAKLDD